MGCSRVEGVGDIVHPSCHSLLMSRGLLLDRAVSLVPEGVQPRLFWQEALGARSGVVLDAGRGPLLLAAAPATGLAAPRVLYGEKTYGSDLCNSRWMPVPHPL